KYYCVNTEPFDCSWSKAHHGTTVQSECRAATDHQARSHFQHQALCRIWPLNSNSVVDVWASFHFAELCFRISPACSLIVMRHAQCDHARHVVHEIPGPGGIKMVIGQNWRSASWYGATKVYLTSKL